jgi:hypothetical protein
MIDDHAVIVAVCATSHSTLFLYMHVAYCNIVYFETHVEGTGA